MSENKKLKAALIYSPDLEKYSYPPDCPFSSKRAGLMRKTLASMGLLFGSDRGEFTPTPASREVLEKFHKPAYLDILQLAGQGELEIEGLKMGLGTPDCPVFLGLYDYAALACGGTLLGAQLLMEGKTKAAFNPSGGYHHAFPSRAAGFCYINDLAVTAITLAEQKKRVLYLDLDAHHGDGVQYAFYDRNDIMTISLHESGKTLFPGTGFIDEIGTGAGLGYSVNVPFPPLTYDAAYLRAFREIALPLVKAYNPDVIILVLGMDGLSGDPLTHLSLTNNAHAEAVKDILALDKPLLITGGGGYNIENTARSWALVWTVLCGEEPELDASAGLGGVMVQTTEWHGGLRDLETVPSEDLRKAVDVEVDRMIEAVKGYVFRYHGLR